MSNRPISVVELERRRLATAASLSKDLETITAWGFKNMVEFNASKTQYCTLSNNKALPRSHSFKLLGVSITENMIWHEQIRPRLEYCSYIWGIAAPTTLSVLDAVQKRAIRLIGDPALTCHLLPLFHRRAVGDLSLFYRYSNGFCSSELTSIIPPLSKNSRCTADFFSPQGGRSSYIKKYLLSLRVLAYSSPASANFA
nr:unnamed protein product [Callosobruchus chinensis]